MAIPTSIAWSTGKDAAWTLEKLLDDPSVELRGLFTTIDREARRVPFQGAGRDLLEIQASATGLPLEVVELPPEADDRTYRSEVGRMLDIARESGIRQIAFGDLHLADLRKWREEFVRDHGLACVFPLWGLETAQLAREMVEAGLEAHLTCVDPVKIDEVWLGRPFDAEFLDALPAGIDPCGENGEFHTFVSGGPMLHERIEVAFADPVDERGFRVAEPVLGFPLDGTLDLHGVSPKEVGDLVDDWIDASRAAGLTRLRIVHGKGIGALRETVHARLRRRADVAGFRLGGEGGGGWGATLVDLTEPGHDR
jgi:uncharacterized protein (TIGR00290 family)